MATILFESGNPAGARAHYEVARTIGAELLQSAGTSEDHWGMIQILRALGDVLGGPDELNLGDSIGALSRYREAAARAEALAGVDPRDVRARRILVSSYASLGRLRLDADPEGALGYYSKSLGMAGDLLRTDESNIEYRREVALSSLAVARCYRRLGRTGEAVQLLARSVELQQPIEAAAPQRIWMNRPLGWIYLEMGNVLLDRNDPDGAVSNFRKGIAAAERLLARAPDSIYLQRDLAEALETTGRGYSTIASRQPATAAQWNADACSLLAKGYSVWDDFRRRGIAAAYTAQRIKKSKDAVAPCREVELGRR
jgi:tetratricopeptide (TPR) repeat protein